MLKQIAKKFRLRTAERGSASVELAIVCSLLAFLVVPISGTGASVPNSLFNASFALLDPSPQTAQSSNTITLNEPSRMTSVGTGRPLSYGGSSASTSYDSEEGDFKQTIDADAYSGLSSPGNGGFSG